jgi:hypothetical protein
MQVAQQLCIQCLTADDVAIMMQLLTCRARRNMRLLSKHYHSYIDSQIMRLKPACLDAEHMRARFPDLVSLDLTRCVQVSHGRHRL